MRTFLIIYTIAFTLASLVAFSLCRAAGKRTPGPPEDQGCEHDWVNLIGEHPDGTRFAKCTKCGLIAEV